jgi:hypothetical protein
MNEFHGIGIYDRPRRKKISPLKIGRASMLGKDKQSNGQREKMCFIKREKECDG